jgi:hypothetical protein
VGMSQPRSRLHPVAAALHPTSPECRPAPAPALAAASLAQPSLFDPAPDPCPSNLEVMP